VVELGLVNATIHQVDERVPVADLETLTRIYERFIARYFAQA
jgi:succinyl-diaminopimelate desuccinylase